MVTLVSSVPSVRPNYVTLIHHMIHFVKHRLSVCLHTGGKTKGFYVIHPAIHTNFLFGRYSYVMYMYVPVCSLITFSRTEFLKLRHFETKVQNSYLKYCSARTEGQQSRQGEGVFSERPSLLLLVHCNSNVGNAIAKIPRRHIGS